MTGGLLPLAAALGRRNRVPGDQRGADYSTEADVAPMQRESHALVALGLTASDCARLGCSASAPTGWRWRRGSAPTAQGRGPATCVGLSEEDCFALAREETVEGAEAVLRARGLA